MQLSYFCHELCGDAPPLTNPAKVFLRFVTTRRTGRPCNRPSRVVRIDLMLNRRPHAASDAQQELERAAGAPRSKQTKHPTEALLDRIDKAVRPVAPYHHVVIEPAEPRELQQFRSC